MSFYINFYIKTKENKYINIFNFSRNSAIYEYGSNFACGEGCELDRNTIENIINNIKQENIKYRDEVYKLKERIKLIAKFNNSVEDKMEEIHNIEFSLNELDEIHNELNHAEIFYGILLDMYDTFKYDEDSGSNKIYYGIEWNPNYKEDE